MTATGPIKKLYDKNAEGRFTALVAQSSPHSGRTVSLRGPRQSPIPPFACCIKSMLSNSRCGLCSSWCSFRVRGAQYLAYWGCTGGYGGRVTAFVAHSSPQSGRTISLWGTRQSTVPPFTCYIRSMLCDGRCGMCSLWCCFHVHGAWYFAYWGCVGGCGGRFTAPYRRSHPKGAMTPSASLWTTW